MRRREFIGLAGFLAVWTRVAHAQPLDRIRRVAILMPYPESDQEVQARVAAMRVELRKLGWLEGKNLHIEERWATDNLDRVRAACSRTRQAGPGRNLHHRRAGRAHRSTADPLYSDRVRRRHGSARARLCGQPRAARREHHWDCLPRILGRVQAFGVAEGDRAQLSDAPLSCPTRKTRPRCSTGVTSRPPPRPWGFSR